MKLPNAGILTPSNFAKDISRSVGPYAKRLLARNKDILAAANVELSAATLKIASLQTATINKQTVLYTQALRSGRKVMVVYNRNDLRDEKMLQKALDIDVAAETITFRPLVSAAIHAGHGYLEFEAPKRNLLNWFPQTPVFKVDPETIAALCGPDLILG